MSTEQGTAGERFEVEPGRLTNGLDAARYVALVDVDAELAPALLDALRRARIAAYADRVGAFRRIEVAADEFSDARPVAMSALRALRPDTAGAWRDPLDSVDTDVVFDQLVANWQVDTVAAVRAAERDLTQQDADWRSRLEVPESAPDDPEEHYVPPPPPPLPKLAFATVGALTVLGAALFVLAFGGWLGLAGDISFMLGIAGILLSAGMLVMRMRDTPDDEDDDGAIV